MIFLKRFFSFFFIFFLSLNLLFSSELSDKLKQVPGIISVESLPSGSFFSERYLLLYEQLIDQSQPQLGSFRQRIFLNHKSYTSPVIYITEGYAADYAESERYIHELSNILQANQICVEHRYFAESTPDNYDIKYLTTKNAAEDHHSIFTSLKTIYQNKWISTGASKGGQTALLYQMYYPNDVDACVAYVCPNSRALVDGRHEKFISKIGSSKDRKIILEYQKELLKRKSSLLPIFEEHINKNNLHFRLPISDIYDYCVLEFGFAFWQFYANTSKIPSIKDSDSKLIGYLLIVAGPSYFSVESLKSIYAFYVQAAKELGYYGYDTQKLKSYLSIKSADNYFNEIFLPDSLNITFNSETSTKLEHFIQTKAKNTLIILGEYDPWSAVAPDNGNNANVIKIINPKGTHASNIMFLPKLKHDLAINKLFEWIK